MIPLSVIGISIPGHPVYSQEPSLKNQPSVVLAVIVPKVPTIRFHVERVVGDGEAPSSLHP